MSDDYYYSSFVGFLGFKSCTPHSLLQPPRPLPHAMNHDATQCGVGDAVCVADTRALPSAYTPTHRAPLSSRQYCTASKTCCRFCAALHYNSSIQQASPSATFIKQPTP